MILPQAARVATGGNGILRPEKKRDICCRVILIASSSRRDELKTRPRRAEASTGERGDCIRVDNRFKTENEALHLTNTERYLYDGSSCTRRLFTFGLVPSGPGAADDGNICNFPHTDWKRRNVSVVVLYGQTEALHSVKRTTLNPIKVSSLEGWILPLCINLAAWRVATGWAAR